MRHPSTDAGGTLRLVIGAVDSLDPARSYFAGVWNVMRLYTRQLVTYAPAPGDAGTVLVPDLATGLGTSTDGGKTWTYTLKPGLKFEDGSPITSRAVKYGIERLFASDLITGGPTWAVTLLDDHRFSYSGPYKDPSGDKLGLSSVRTPDDRTIQFRLNRPFADWNYVMALPASSPVPRAADTGAKYGGRPVSSGPYKIAKATSTLVTLVRNPAWSRQTDSVRSALPDRVELAVVPSAEERDRQMLAGTADADLTGSGLQPAAATRVLDSPSLKARTDNPTTGDIRLVAVNTSLAPLNNVHCRRAVQYAVDKAAVKSALGGPYAAALATTLWPRGLPGYPATVKFPDGPGNHGDLAAARRELASCGHRNGFSTKLATVDSGRGARAAEVVSRSLRRVGIRATVVRFSQNTFLLSDVGSPKQVQADRIGLIMSAWSPDFPSPSAFYIPLTDGRSIHSLGNSNLAELRETPLEKAVDKAEGSLDLGTSTVLWQHYDASVMDSAAYLPVVEDRALIVGSSRLRNAYVHRAYDGYDVATLGVR
ncbi:MAG TPA: ABC transporter substrate-binding protein [Mycobacteriales bacterium]|nr:ABC transporter substrate-binding protein [Mycobacteriales bacterium]